MKVLASNILVLALCLALGNAAVRGQRPSGLRTDTSLMQLMVDNRAASAKSPEQSIACFNHYTPLMSEIASKYEKDYEDCYKTAAFAQRILNNTTETERNALNSLATSSCSAIASCYTLSEVDSSFECFQSVSNTNTKEFYTMAKTAKDNQDNAREKRRVIKADQNRCQDACDSAYVKNTADTYEELKSCLAGLTEVPTTTTTTEPQATTEAPENSESERTEEPVEEPNNEENSE